MTGNKLKRRGKNPNNSHTFWACTLQMIKETKQTGLIWLEESLLVINCSGLMLRLRNVQLPKLCGKVLWMIPWGCFWIICESLFCVSDWSVCGFVILWLVVHSLGRGHVNEDQFEVSECTLPGPSVGEITEDGVVASCHPPLPWKQNRKNKKQM